MRRQPTYRKTGPGRRHTEIDLTKRKGEPKGFSGAKLMRKARAKKIGVRA